MQVTCAQAEDYSDIPNSQIRRITAKRLLESKQTVPHYYLTIDCRVDKLVQLRQQLNAGLAKDGKKLSVNDFVVKASAQASLHCHQHHHSNIPAMDFELFAVKQQSCDWWLHTVIALTESSAESPILYMALMLPICHNLKLWFCSNTVYKQSQALFQALSATSVSQIEKSVGLHSGHQMIHRG